MMPLAAQHSLNLIVYDLVLSFAPTGTLTHRIDTTNASAYTARYPDGSVETIASGVVHAQTLPAGTSGNVLFRFTGVAKASRISDLSAVWNFNLAAIANQDLTHLIATGSGVGGTTASLSAMTRLASVYVASTSVSVDIAGLSPSTGLTSLQTTNRPVSGDLATLPLSTMTLLQMSNAGASSATVTEWLQKIDAAGMKKASIVLGGTNGARDASTHGAVARIQGRDNSLTVNGSALWSPIGKTWVTAYYDFGVATSLALSNGKIVQANDLSGNARHATQAVAANQPAYNASDARAGGLATMGQQDHLGTVGLVTPSMTASRAYVSAAYKTGVETTFASFDSILGGPGTNSRRRVIGTFASADMYSDPGDRFAPNGRINGNAASLTVLPLPLSTLVFTAEAAYTQTYHIAYSPANANRNWAGPMRHFILSNGTESTADRDRVEGFMAWRNNTQGRLNASHAYKTAPPLA